MSVAEKTGRGINILGVICGIFYSSMSDATSSYLICAHWFVVTESGSLPIRTETKMTQGFCSFSIFVPAVASIWRTFIKVCIK